MGRFIASSLRGVIDLAVPEDSDLSGALCTVIAPEVFFPAPDADCILLGLPLGGLRAGTLISYVEPPQGHLPGGQNAGGDGDVHQ